MNNLLLKMKNIREAKFDYKKKFIHVKSDNINIAKMLNEQFPEFHAKVVKLVKMVRYLSPGAKIIVIKE